MCRVQTAAPDGQKKKNADYKTLGLLQQLIQHVCTALGSCNCTQNAWRNLSRKRPQPSSDSPKKPSKIDPRGFKIDPGGPKRHPRASKRGPRRVQEAFKTTQVTPKGFQRRSRGSQDRPKRLQNRSPNLKKSMLKNITFLALFFSSFGPRFGGVSRWFLDAETCPKQKKLNFEKPYKTLAMATKSRVGVSKIHSKNNRKP